MFTAVRLKYCVIDLFRCSVAVESLCYLSTSAIERRATCCNSGYLLLLFFKIQIPSHIWLYISVLHERIGGFSISLCLDRDPLHVNHKLARQTLGVATTDWLLKFLLVLML